MSVLTEGNFIIRTYKRAVGNPSYVWSNTYEFTLGEGTFSSYQDVTDMGLAFLTAEQPIHGTNVEFVKAVISTWAPGDPELGYQDPESFVVAEPYSGTMLGTRTMSTDPLPRHIALFVRRAVEYGHPGKLFYRGALCEGDIQSTSALDARLASGAVSTLDGLVTDLSEALTSLFSSWTGGLAMIRAITGLEMQEVRLVTGLGLVGVTVNQPNHAYFDRA